MPLTGFPISVDTFTTHIDNNNEKVAAAHVNKLQEGMSAVQNEILNNYKKLLYGCILIGMFSGNVTKGAVTFDGNGKPTSQTITGTGLTGTITWNWSVATQCTETLSITAPIALTVTKVVNLTTLAETWTVS